MDVETTTNNTLTKAIDQVEQIVIAVEQWRQTLAESTSWRALFDNDFKFHVEKEILQIAVGQFRALAVEGCTLAKGTKLNATTIYTSSVVDPEQIMKVTSSAPAKIFKDSWVQIRDAFRVLNLFTTTHLEEKYEDEFAELDLQLDVASLNALARSAKQKLLNCVVLACTRNRRSPSRLARS